MDETLWKRNRPAYFAELDRFLACHREAMAAKTDELRAQVRQGPQSWVAATTSRLAALPRPMQIRPDVFLNRGGSETALGMCGVIRPLLGLERL